MPEQVFTVLATVLAQAAAGLVVGLLLYSLYRYYGKGYLLYWSWSWIVLGIFHLAHSVGIFVSPRFGIDHPVRIILFMIGGTAGFLQIAWLIFGAWELGTRRILYPNLQRFVVPLAVVLGITTPLILLAAPQISSERTFITAAVRGLIAGVAFLASGFIVWKGRARQVGFGFKLISAAFILYGLNQFHYALIASMWGVGFSRPTYPSYLGFFDFTLQALMGFGMVASLLEDEREAAVLATVEIEHLAYHDALTSLPNRLLFMDRLAVGIAQAQRYQQKLAVLYLDIDRFKEINESLGHSAGDALLKLVADRLRNSVRQADTVARFGGDEFAVLVQKIESFEDTAKVAQKILEMFNSPFALHDREVFVSTSIGITIFPDDALDAESLIKNADVAMYRAKEQGRDNYQLYEPTMNARALERLALENELRKALAHHELVLFYQPLVDLKTKKVIAFEALIRWNHPQMGLLSPAHFIAAAEISGLIIPIGSWVLRMACTQAKAWQRHAPGIGVSVNLSARQFLQPDLVSEVELALAESGLAPDLLELEITETNAMQDADRSIDTLIELKTLGVRISMDDFGTGYSSLSYLKRFPIDILKLDKSFVSDITSNPQDGAIATAVIAMAHSLSLKVVAEGVETRVQLDFLKDRLCDRIQGYLFSPPLAPADFQTFIKQSRHTGWSELREFGDIWTDVSH